MIYVDTSVVLAQVLSEDRRPPDSLWHEAVISSQLLKYEAWIGIGRFGADDSHHAALGRLLDGIMLVEMTPRYLDRARAPFPRAARTLDALHLSTLVRLVEDGHAIQLASYDRRMLDIGSDLGISLAPL